MPTFQEFLAARRKLNGAVKEHRLPLIEAEAMDIARRELSNAMFVAQQFFPQRKLTMEDLLAVQNLIAGFYGLAIHELIDKGVFERPSVVTVPAGAPVSETKPKETGN